jgi:hypothetical protein
MRPRSRAKKEKGAYDDALYTRIVADLQRQLPDLQVQWVPVTVE